MFALLSDMEEHVRIFGNVVSTWLSQIPGIEKVSINFLHQTGSFPEGQKRWPSTNRNTIYKYSKRTIEYVYRYSIIKLILNK